MAVANADHTNLTLADLWKAHRHLPEVLSFVTAYLLGEACPMLLPIPQYNQFKHIEKPLITPDHARGRQELWLRFREECESWNEWGLDAYEREFGKADQAASSRGEPIR